MYTYFIQKFDKEYSIFVCLNSLPQTERWIQS